MLSPSAIIAACSLYMVVILAAAVWVERKALAGKNVANSAVIYALSLTVYHTAWTFYGNVGKAASSGMLFATIYLGPTLAALLWWVVLRKMVSIRNTYKITSIADFISLRYNKSTPVAALVTVICIFALVPYFALQLKAMTAAFSAATDTGASSPAALDAGLLFSGLILLLTVFVGVRRLAPTARHQGAVVALAVASQLKLAAFLAVGLYVTYGLFGGVGDIFQRFARSPLSARLISAETSPSFYLSWLTYLLLSMSAVMFLPGQFHLQVVENFRKRHIRTAMWLLPLYMLLISFFVLPIALGGLLTGLPQGKADVFTIMLPLSYGHTVLPLFTFVGGFAAATGMIMISSMTVSTMATNHLLLPVIESIPFLGFMKRYLLQCRWVTVAVVIFAAYLFQALVGGSLILADIGVIAFAAVLQFAPAIIGGLFWKKGNTAGALAGMVIGFLLWLYTLVVPVFVRGGLLPASLLDQGPCGIGMLRPEHLLGMSGVDPITHAVLYTLLFNLCFYVLGSLYGVQEERERAIADKFVDALAAGPVQERLPGEATVVLAEKRTALEHLYGEYFLPAKAAELTADSLSGFEAGTKQMISIAELAELYRAAEIRLASAIGAAAAHKAMVKAEIISDSEEKALQQLYVDLIAKLKMTPSDLMRRIDYHREREDLLRVQAAELEEKVRDRDREIAERRKAEEALRSSERRFADIIDFLPDPTFVVDAEGKIIIWNRAAEEFTGVKAEDMLGKGNYEYSLPFFGRRRPLLVDLVLHPSEEIKALYPRVVRQGRVLIDESPTRSVIRGQGYVVITAAPLYDAEGKITAVIELVRDVTERRQALEELKKHRDKLEEMVRERTAELNVAKERAEVASQAKSAFLSSMSHELRTPLNAILGYAHILRRESNLTGGQRRQLDIMRASGEHLLMLINDVLDMSKIEAQKMELEEESFDLCALLRQVFDISKVKAEEKSLDFRYHEATALPKYARGDQRKLKQVLLNLLSNAVKYTRRGEVIMSVAHDPDTGIFRCDITDTGIGIAPDKLESIFEPFTQVAGAGQVREGSGLGLTITKRLLTLMQGKVAVESEPGKGSTFRVELPLPAVPATEICDEAAAQNVTGYRGDRKRMLVADDNVTNTSMLVSLLEPLGFQILTASNGRDAVRQALERRPDLVLLDLVMPEMDGLEAVEEMKKLPELQKIPIVGTSAAASGSPRKEPFMAACDDFLVKPLRVELLLDKIRVLLGIEWEAEPSEKPSAEAAAAESGEEEWLEAPPPEELAELHELASLGNMQKIQSWASMLEQRDARYAAFAARLRDLAGRFKAKAVVALVERYMRERP